MSTYRKILIGGMGALAPILINLIVVDLETTLTGITLIVAISYTIRVFALFSIGGLVAYLHKEETSAVKLFELGIMAPALIMAYHNGTQVPALDASPHSSGTNSTVEVGDWLPGLLYAQPPPVTPISSSSQFADSVKQDSILSELNVFSLPEESTTEQLKRGLLGATSKRVYFVLVGKDTSHANAKTLAKELLKGRTGYTARIYEPYGDDPFYSIGIESHLTYEEAATLRVRAIKEGFPKETNLWTFPIKH